MQLSFPLLLRGVACAYDFRWVVNQNNKCYMEHYQQSLFIFCCIFFTFRDVAIYFIYSRLAAGGGCTGR